MPTKNPPDFIANLSKLVTLSLKKNAAFCLYRIPFEDNIKSIFSGFANAEIISQDDIFKVNSTGFVVAPFDLSKKIFFIKDQHKSVNELESEFSSMPAQFEKEQEFSSTSKSDYFRMFSNYMHSIQSGKMSKAVLSRLHVIQKEKSFDPFIFFKKLCQTYTSAFCYLLNIPGYGLWCGATPERLLSANGTELKTVALAGTLPNSEKYLWSQKEKTEQELVSQHIRTAIDKAGYKSFLESQPSSSVAGQIKHLKTEFNIPVKQGNVEKLLKNLHPTPAVGGLPQTEAASFIHKTENHDRSLYTGFLGPIDSTTKFDIYVNLRCMQITSRQLILYLGGGITADSDPEREWRETENKAGTLLKILEDQQDL